MIDWWRENALSPSLSLLKYNTKICHVIYEHATDANNKQKKKCKILMWQTSQSSELNFFNFVVKGNNITSYQYNFPCSEMGLPFACYIFLSTIYRDIQFFIADILLYRYSLHGNRFVIMCFFFFVKFSFLGYAYIYDLFIYTITHAIDKIRF